MKDIFPDKTCEETAELVADFFTSIADEFEPLIDQEIPASATRGDFIPIREEEVIDGIKSCKKPNGLLHGDIFLGLLVKYCDVLSTPLTNVFNSCMLHECWPSIWKLETVSVIQKCPGPCNLGETHNISCTPIFSKIFEFFILSRLKKDVKPGRNQFGGISGSSRDHYLTEAWTDIMYTLDQEGSACNFISVDFVKPFNTIGHQHCISSKVKKNVANHTARMVGRVLKNRMMQFRVGYIMSSLRPLRGGAPQGMLLGNYLFVLATDDLERTGSHNDESNGVLESVDLRTGSSLLLEWNGMGPPARSLFQAT